jgi:hypothetical protein
MCTQDQVDKHTDSLSVYRMPLSQSINHNYYKKIIVFKKTKHLSRAEQWNNGMIAEYSNDTSRQLRAAPA